MKQKFEIEIEFPDVCQNPNWNCDADDIRGAVHGYFFDNYMENFARKCVVKVFQIVDNQSFAAVPPVSDFHQGTAGYERLFDNGKQSEEYNKEVERNKRLDEEYKKTD